ncbi:MAG: hypothetical protein V6Z89_17460 [Desulfobacter sp.]
MEKERSGGDSMGGRLTLGAFAVSLSLYFLNIILGKASLHWGWNVFYLGNVSEFLLLLVASVSFVAAVLHRESKARQGNNSNHN